MIKSVALLATALTLAPTLVGAQTTRSEYHHGAFAGIAIRNGDGSTTFFDAHGRFIGIAIRNRDGGGPRGHFIGSHSPPRLKR
jgi:hypothetical protein